MSQHIRSLEEEYWVHLIKKYDRGFDLIEEELILLKYLGEIEDLYR